MGFGEMNFGDKTKDLKVLEELPHLFFMAMVLIGDMLVSDVMIVGNAIVRALAIVVLSVDYPETPPRAV